MAQWVARTSIDGTWWPSEPLKSTTGEPWIRIDSASTTSTEKTIQYTIGPRIVCTPPSLGPQLFLFVNKRNASRFLARDEGRVREMLRERGEDPTVEIFGPVETSHVASSQYIEDDLARSGREGEILENMGTEIIWPESQWMEYVLRAVEKLSEGKPKEAEHAGQATRSEGDSPSDEEDSGSGRSAVEV